MTKYFNKKIKILLLSFTIIGVFTIFTPVAKASTEVYFLKGVSTINIGDTFSVSLIVSSADKTINVVEGTIKYDKEKLSIEHVKKNDSLFSLWVKEPIINNSIGELSFVAGVPNGYKGSGRQILEITFLAKGKGIAQIGFKDMFSVYANDGKGTRINPWLKPMQLSINDNEASSSIEKLTKGFGIQSWIIIIAILLLFLVIIAKRRKNKDDK